MNMKKLLSILLTTVLAVLPLSACNTAKSDTNHIFYYDYSDTYIASVRDAMDDALEAAGLEFQNHDAQNSQTTQTEQVNTAVLDAPVLVVNYVQTNAADPAEDIVEQARNNEIPVVFFNREVSDELINSYEQAYFVGTDAAEAGHLQGEMIGNYLVENYDAVDLNGDGVISYALMKGENGNNESEMRTQFAVEDANAILVENGYPELAYFDEGAETKYQVDMDGNWSAAAAQEYMSTNLATYSDANDNMIELVISNNDSMAEGAVSALNTVGYNTTENPEQTIPVFGVDATAAAVALIESGQMAGTIKQDAVGMANTIVDILVNLHAEKGAFDGLDVNVDSNVDKVRIPYQIITGE